MAISKYQSINKAFIGYWKAIEDAKCVVAHSAGWTKNLTTGQCQLGS
jgi:hypothetical protein